MLFLLTVKGGKSEKGMVGVPSVNCGVKLDACAKAWPWITIGLRLFGDHCETLARLSVSAHIALGSSSSADSGLQMQDHVVWRPS